MLHEGFFAPNLPIGAVCTNGIRDGLLPWRRCLRWSSSVAWAPNNDVLGLYENNIVISLGDESGGWKAIFWLKTEAYLFSLDFLPGCYFQIRSLNMMVVVSLAICVFIKESLINNEIIHLWNSLNQTYKKKIILN